MLRDEYLRRLVDRSYIELYLSSNDGARIYWPYRMQPPKEASKKYRNACERYIIDSDPLDDSVTTSDVLDTAHRLGAEVASLQDVYLNKDATVDSLLHGLEIADDHSFDGELLLPLQQPYVNCYKELGEPDELIGLGGLKKGTPYERIDAARSFRAEFGYGSWLHGFGWGVKGELSKAIRNEPRLLDSVDYSTPIQTAVNKVELPGKERMSVQAMHAATKLVTDLRSVSPYPREANSKREEGQLELTI